MSHSKFFGIVPPVVTPFTADGNIDWDSLDSVIEMLITAGNHGLFVMGSTGEVAYLTNSQRTQIIKRAVEVAKGRVPIIAGAIDQTAQRCIEQAKAAESAGADAVVITAPVYAINDESEIEQHFRTVSEALNIPLFAYDIPVRINKKLSPDLLVRLGKEGVIVGVKDSSGDDVSFRRLLAKNKAAGSPLRLFTGHEVVVDCMLFAGADGVVPGLGNVDPNGYTRLWNAAQAKDWETARLEQEKLNALFEIVFLPKGRSGDAAGVGAFKTAMAALGTIATNTMAAPVVALDGEVADQISKLAREHLL